MRLVGWNIRAGGGYRAERICEALITWRPDLVALCEFRGTPPSRHIARQLAAHGLRHQRESTLPADPARNALLLASRWPLRNVGVRARPDEPGRWLMARASAPRPISIGVMHVPNRHTGRKYPYLDRVEAIASRWRGGRAVLIGDTNSGCPGIDETSEAFNARECAFLRRLERAGWCDGFRALHGDQRVYSWYSPNAGNGFRLDQVFVHRSVAPGLRSVRYEWPDGQGSGVSDHAALIVDLIDGSDD